MGVKVQVISRVDEAVLKIDTAAVQRLEMAALFAVGKVQEKLTNQPSRTGERYRVPGTKRFYTASAPGEPPALRLGGLRSSVKHMMDPTGFRAAVGTELDYGLFLEMGTSTIEKRPWLRTTLDEEKQGLMKILAGNWFA